MNMMTTNSKSLSLLEKRYLSSHGYSLLPHLVQVAAYGRLFLTLSFLGLAAGCIIYMGSELFPSRMSPNSIFSEAFELLRTNDQAVLITTFDLYVNDHGQLLRLQIVRLVGDDMKAFGRDTGRNTEGRRNLMDSYRSA
jgi:import inner membrane translocase subunit TIM21